MPYIAAEQRVLEISVDGNSLINAIAGEVACLVAGGAKRGLLVRTVVAGLINGVYGGIRVAPYEPINTETAELRACIKQLTANIITIRNKYDAGQNGLLNYTITRVLNEVYPAPRYHDYNEVAGLLTGLMIRSDTEDDEVLGILDCCKTEYYRKYCAPYEDLKESENGVVTRPTGAPSTY